MKFNKMKTNTFLLFFLCVSVALHGQKNSNPLKIADSLFLAQNWKAAKNNYEITLKDTSKNSLAWNRLGFADQNLNLYSESIKCYNKALALSPSPTLKPIVLSRLARVYSLTKNSSIALTTLDSAISSGYVNIKELDSLNDFNNIRNTKLFSELRKKAYENANPCMTDPKCREFDFWVGEWNVYVTGTTQLAGHSLIQIISGGCAILENWDSPNSTGKSINFIDPTTNKWKQSWAGNYASGIQEFVNGEYFDNAMRFTFEFKDKLGKKTRGRFIFYNEGKDQVRQFNETSVDDGKSWQTNYDFTYKRS